MTDWRLPQPGQELVVVVDALVAVAVNAALPKVLPEPVR